MSGATYYDGPQLTGAAIDANVFCVIDPTADPRHGDHGDRGACTDGPARIRVLRRA